MVEAKYLNRRRVVITGAGVVTPVGCNLETFWSNIKNGVSGIDFIKKIKTDDQNAKIAGEVKDLDAEAFIDKKELRRMDENNVFAICAAEMAYKDANFTTPPAPERFGVIVSSAAGGIGTIENNLIELLQKGYKRCSPFLVPMMISNMAAGRISIRHNAKGPNFAVVTACATGADSVGEAMRAIIYDEADVMFAGGTEASITPLSIAGFAACRALSLQDKSPDKACRPFDIGRDGFIMAEGSVVLILEELEHAKKRGAKIYAELVGYGRSADAHDIVSPPEDGGGAAMAIRHALKDAGIQPEQIGYVNAHATSTPLGDIAETNAIKSVFGEHATSKKLLVSATKSMTGHLLGAAGSIEALITALALKEQIIPPTINLENPDPKCDLDYVPNTARSASDLTFALSNSFGFGGHNASLILRRWDE